MKLMGLSGVTQTEHISPLLQLLIQILSIARRGFHPNEDLAGRRIQLAQFLLPELPSLPDIGKSNRFDHDAFVEPENAAHAGLASNINPTDILDRHVLRRECRCRCFHHTPACLLLSPSLVILFDATIRLLAARNPTDRGERQLMLDRQSSPARETARLLQQAS